MKVETVPSTAKGVPLLCQYIVFTMVLVCLSIMITVVVLNVHYRGSATHVMSDRVKKVFLKLCFYAALSTIVLSHFNKLLFFTTVYVNNR